MIVKLWRVLFRFREQREQLERDHQQEVNLLQKTNKECSLKLDTLQTLLAEKEVIDFRKVVSN